MRDGILFREQRRGLRMSLVGCWDRCVFSCFSLFNSALVGVCVFWGNRARVGDPGVLDWSGEIIIFHGGC